MSLVYIASSFQTFFLLQIFWILSASGRFVFHSPSPLLIEKLSSSNIPQFQCYVILCLKLFFNWRVGIETTVWTMMEIGYCRIQPLDRRRKWVRWKKMRQKQRVRLLYTFWDFRAKGRRGGKVESSIQETFSQPFTHARFMSTFKAQVKFLLHPIPSNSMLLFTWDGNFKLFNDL